MDKKERFRGTLTNHHMEQFPVLSNDSFYQQGAKFNTLSVLAPPYISKMTKLEDTKEFEISGYIPEIWFALQVINNAISYKLYNQKSISN